MTTTPAKPASKPAKSAAPKASKAFEVDGDFQMGRVRQHFTLQVAAANETAAKDRVYATLGSRHGVNRRQVSIAHAKAVTGEDVTDAIVRHELGLAHQQ